ncbi:MAG: caspase family protein [Proteobacteria bacterium]|nr:caspase family protein [Pseudomonadota bacterium]
MNVYHRRRRNPPASLIQGGENTRYCRVDAVLAILFIAAAAIAIVPTQVEAQGAYPETIHRFAFVAGSNDGGSSRVPLRYAHTDAKAMARVLRQLGGVSTRDSIVLLEPDRFDFEAGLARMRGRLENSQASGIRVELVVYYSGHSDEQGLMLGEDLITYRELRSSIAELPADVRIAILDSCSSGALTRGKGGTRRPPFLLDTSVDVKGYAYLTSSSADETAQESDRVGGSFFTHYLVSGLRGAADTSQDGKVTLNEAYQYAFNETLARTESTQAGPQHPNYDFQLKGSGDLVLTDLRGTSALLVLTDSLEGRVFIRNRRGQLVAEINKPGGHEISLGLEPGHYEVTLESSTKLSKGTVNVTMAGSTKLDNSNLKNVSPEKTIVRGGKPDETPLEDATEDEEITHRVFRFGFVPGLTTDGGAEGKTLNDLSINFIGRGDYLRGAEFGAIGNIRNEDVKGFQAATIFNFTLGEVKGFQGAGIFNLSRNALVGFQGAGIANMVYGPIEGFQGAGIANVNTNGSALGFQGAGIFNFNGGGAFGFQGAGITNIDNGDVQGFQGAGIANVTKGKIKGFQGAGIANVSATGHAVGFQGAGISNVADSITGAQISGIANVAYGRVRGFQAGLINYGKEVQGVQLGLVNVSQKNDGVPVGLLNVVGNGMLAPAMWWSDSSLVNLGLKIGSRYLYSMVGYGFHPIGDRDERRDSLFTGLGGHLDFNPVWLELDIVFHWLHADFDWSEHNIDFLHKFRVTVGWRVVDQLSLFAGPTVNLLVSDTRNTVELIPSLWSEGNHDVNLSLSLGIIVGLQWEPKWGSLNSWW